MLALARCCHHRCPAGPVGFREEGVLLHVQKEGLGQERELETSVGAQAQ